MSTVTVEERAPVGGMGDYTQDGTLDLKGRPVLRSTTGRWKACYFIVGYEIFERMAYYGIASNLVIYLTQQLHEGTVTSSNNVTNWVGTVWMTPLLGAYIADTYLGRYWTFIIASAIYLAGMSLLTLAVSLPSLRPPSCGHGVKAEDCDKRASTLQIGIFYLALYIIAIGTGGTKPNISTMGDQFDDYEPKERFQKLSFFNWWMFSIFLGTLFSNTFLIYIQDNVGWAIGYGLPTAGLAVSIVVFIVGTQFYRHKPPSGSPLARMAQVLVATVRKWGVVVPAEPKELYELSLEEYSNSRQFRLDHSSSLSLLDKAAVRTGPSSPWMLCPVTQHHAGTDTDTLHQTRHNVGTGHRPPFQDPTSKPRSIHHHLHAHQHRHLRPSLRPFRLQIHQKPRGITLLQRMAIGLILQVITMITACLAERRRLSVARANGIFKKGETIPLSIFILLPQFALMGIADNFVEVAKIEFFYDQAPEGMKSLGTAYFTTSLGVGYFLSSFLLSTVADVTKKYGKGWILDNLNLSHLDYYYAFYAVLSFINLVFFLVVAKLFVYNTETSHEELELQAAEEEESSKCLDDRASTEISQKNLMPL
ncbi:UNVERIFIED_CONTAM: protein NRT1/ PTR FAMILY 5.2 [Sesamum radiatum]|uniref:Protein NRT1/ PTR FAMILY 5.2 n=2 Tax=Sesamum TaxID=4181 RepID=A0AAW2URG7_SESRA